MDRSFQFHTGTAVASATRSDLIAIANYTKPLTGAAFYNLLTRNEENIANLTIVIDGVTYTDYEVLRKHVSDLFEATFDVNDNMTITKVGES